MLAALVLARVIAEAGSSVPNLDDGDVLLIQRQHVQVGPGCPAPGDAGVDAGADAGPDDAGVGDAGVDDGGTPDAGCEVIEGDAVTLVVQPRFSQVTTGARFAVLMVTPTWPILEASSPYVFDELAEVTAPRIVEHVARVEDPALGKTCSDGEGCAQGPYNDDPSWNPPGLGDGGVGTLDGGYTVDTVGPYQILRAQPATTAELEDWLSELNYLTLPADLAAVAPYIERGYTVVAVRVPMVTTPERDLTPIALTWASSELRLPVALGTPAGGTAHETTVYIASSGRRELPGADVTFAWRTGWGDAGFLTKNVVVLDSDGNPDHDPVAAVVPDVLDRNTTEIYTTKRVPVVDCEIGCDGGCGECSTQRRVRGDWLIVTGVVILTLRRKRRRR